MILKSKYNQFIKCLSKSEAKIVLMAACHGDQCNVSHLKLFSFCDCTGIEKRNVLRALKTLEEKNFGSIFYFKKMGSEVKRS